jgi:lambda family phage portal protein
MPLNRLDRAIAWASPRWGASRALGRMRLERAAGMTRLYEAGKAGMNDGWVVTGGDANGQILPSAKRVRRAARDLARNNTWARKAIQTWRTAAGPVRPRAMLPGPAAAPRRVKGGPTDRVDTLWYEHWQACAETGRLAFDEGQLLAIGELVEAGEFLIRRVAEPSSAGLPVPFSFQVLEAEFLDDTRDRALDDGGVVIGGVEFDPAGVPRAYWLWREHPESWRVFTKRGLQSVRVPASEVCHVFERTRTGQARGVSWFAPAVLRMHDLDAYDSYELIRKKAEACLVAIVFNGDPAETLGATDGADPTVKDGYGTRIESFEPGMIAYSQGRDIRMNEPKGATDTGFVRQQLHACAAALGLTYERLTGDLSQVSFISGRMGEIQFRPRVREIQETLLIPRCGERLWRWWQQAAYAAGKIDRPDYWARWDRPRWESIQPLEDATASLMLARSGRETVPDQIAADGRDWLEELDQLEAWNAELDRRGIILDSDPRRIDKRGQAQQAANESTLVPDEPAAPPAPGAAPKPAGDGQANGRHCDADGMITEVLKLVNGQRARENANGRV